MAGSAPARRPSVVVTSEFALFAETVAAGLASRGFEATTVDWSTEEDRDDDCDSAPPSDGDVGLLISDLQTWERLRTAWLLIASLPLPWVVLTGAPPGATWGAALDAGACLVLPSSTGLKPVCRVLTKAARGTAHTVPAEQEALVGLWAELLARRELISQQIGSLTPREREVLTMLHAGDRIARIAELLGVSPVTVRSQVKAILRKLEVNSQLGAVAVLDDLLALEPWQ